MVLAMNNLETKQLDSEQKVTMAQLANGCEMYDPCPLCYKCMNKATHMYKRCEGCKVPHDAHTHKNRAFFIRRENFAVKLKED